MIADLRTTTRENAEQDWLKTNLARITNALQGQRDLQAVAQLLMSRDLAARARPARRVLPAPRRQRRAAARRRLRLGRARRGGRALRASARGCPGRRPSRCGASSSPTRRRTTCKRRERAGGGAARRARRAAHPVRGPGPGRPRARVAGAVHRRRPDASSTSSPRRSASCSRRSSPTGAPRSSWTTSAASPASCRPQQEELRQTNEELQEKAALLVRQNRDIEDKNAEIERAPRGARGARRPARAVVALQERVPGQHEPRAAHAAELAAHPRAAAGRQPVGEPHRRAGRVRAHDPRRRHGPARPDLRHPRPVQGRGGQDGRRPGVDRGRGRARGARARLPARRRGQGAGLHGRGGAGRAGRDRHRRAARRPGPAQPAVQRGEVHRRRRGAGAARRAGATAPYAVAFVVADTGIGIAADKQASSSRPSSRPTGRRAAGTAARAWACRSAAS